VIIGRIIGWVLIAIGLMLVGVEALASLRGEEWAPQLLGQLWFELDSGSLNLTQAIVQRYLLPTLWDPVILTLLLWPAWAVFLVPGVVLSVLCRDRTDKYGPKKYLD